MRLDKLTIKSQEAVAEAVHQAEETGHPQAEPLHLLAALLEQPEGIVRSILKKLGADLPRLDQETAKGLEQLPQVSGAHQVPLGQETQTVIETASKTAGDMHDDYVSVEHLLMALAVVPSKAAEILTGAGATPEVILKALV
ncbi:MAG: hypothetical protein JRC92_10230, partial [Deltaproteobacteria bacterium]|nr:hypothetical protein [Deltaproteobacteria bacterium]